mmetsp:Transcript_9169/g.15742  ORF Transcript_9169/g.15742 Transcript_9169/m.15742 type:complete len:123 (-) Transcript_9169:97-465(-)|eukprot:CAMPEP_0198202582 /NCGR_PEP_ID=MMETSP1445-20131203/5769_1 /TAXON_ID=36898 /ORGANISM="Pyramimonas sp., Strain CCMP2087" /LENGTH=122 /DNA_ID=CAMNT_0043873579 /DNA_START=350 /DNA_END=718 /DNA_ORIENTATION=+
MNTRPKKVKLLQIRLVFFNDPSDANHDKEIRSRGFDVDLFEPMSVLNLVEERGPLPQQTATSADHFESEPREPYVAPGDVLQQERSPENFTGYLTEEDEPDFDEEEERGMDGSEDEDDEAPL